MFDILFEYFDGNDYICKDIKKIVIPTQSGNVIIQGDEILQHQFRIHSEIYLYSDSRCYTVSCSNLKALEVLKK